MTVSENLDLLTASVKSLSLNSIGRHVLICADQTLPKCCDKADSLIAWDYLKRRLKELGLDAPTIDRPQFVFRTKANCLRVCQNGPILLVYPDGVWYRSATPDVIEQIIQQHLIGNQIVQEYAFCIQPLMLIPAEATIPVEIAEAEMAEQSVQPAN
ncbi:ferredoxin [Microcoleus sp. FACHB-1515]|uniref:(2Fe-2S) ferredoxin domain-containing protein n=1 Tax=Cyanophyceae TaxID=3028117 RepID=UPI001F55A14E|nr:ferredoxin [Microcoleus sp. FACHB-1515]